MTLGGFRAYSEPLAARMEAKIEETVSELRMELKAFKGVQDTWGEAQQERA